MPVMLILKEAREEVLTCRKFLLSSKLSCTCIRYYLIIKTLAVRSSTEDPDTKDWAMPHLFLTYPAIGHVY
jgi:hypothetical protein